MKQIAALYIGLILVVQIYAAASVDGSTMPNWVNTRPVSSLDYIGIASVSKKQHPRDYSQIGKAEALRDLASEISITISSEFIENLSGNTRMTADEVRSYICSSTEAKLEGYELAGQWETKDDFYVYYRLSKSEYIERKEAPKQRAISLALEFLGTARKYEIAGNISGALTSYVQAIFALDGFIAEPLKVEDNGQTIFLQNELFSSLQKMINGISLESTAKDFSVKVGKKLNVTFPVSVTYINERNEKRPATQFPLRFDFTKGNGNLMKHVVANENGLATCYLSNVISPDKLQIVKAQPDIIPASQDSIAPLAHALLNNLNLPEVKFILNVEGPTICLKSEELQFDNKLADSYVEPQIKKALSGYGFVFSDDLSHADLLFEVKANTRRGQRILDYNMFSAFGDVTLSVTELSSGTEIFKDGLSNIKAIEMNYEKAGVSAMVAAGDSLVKTLPAILNKIRN